MKPEFILLFFLVNVMGYSQSIVNYTISVSDTADSPFGGNKIEIQRTTRGGGIVNPFKQLQIRVNGNWINAELTGNRMVICHIDNSMGHIDTSAFTINSTKYLDLYWVFRNNPDIISYFHSSNQIIGLREAWFYQVDENEYSDTTYSETVEVVVPRMSESDLQAFQSMPNDAQLDYFFNEKSDCCTLEVESVILSLIATYPETALGLMAKRYRMKTLYHFSFGKDKEAPINDEIRALCGELQDSSIDVIRERTKNLCSSKM